MNESQMFEALGRKQAQLEAQDAAYTSILCVLAGVVSGDIAPARVKVDLVARTWAVAADEQPVPAPE